VGPGRAEARDFCRHLQIAGKPRPPQAAAVPVPGKRPSSAKYAPSTVAHCETVCRGFYGYHLEAGTGPLVNRSRWPGRNGRTPTTTR